MVRHAHGRTQPQRLSRHALLRLRDDRFRGHDGAAPAWWLPGKLAEVDRGADEAIRAYEDVGMRVSYSFAVRDQNRLVYQRDEDFVASLPSELRGPMQRWYDRFQLSLDDCIASFESLHGRLYNKRRVKVQLAPANLHWCSDKALRQLSDTSRKYGVPLHIHLLVTAYQKEYARRRRGGTAVEYIGRFDLLGRQMTFGHGVWLNERDIDRLAKTGTCVCHNCSSNFSAAFRCCGAERIGSERGQHSNRYGRGWHQRRPRYAAGDAVGVAHSSRARDGGRRADGDASIPDGDHGRRQNHRV